MSLDALIDKYFPPDTTPLRDRRYEVLTWDMHRQTFTPQDDVNPGPHSLWDLKRALRELQACGYQCDRRHGTCGDSAVYVSRAETGRDGK